MIVLFASGRRMPITVGEKAACPAAIAAIQVLSISIPAPFAPLRVRKMIPVVTVLFLRREDKQGATLLTTNLSCLVFVHTTTSFQNNFVGTNAFQRNCNENRF